jgi:hypothetical protein
MARLVQAVEGRYALDLNNSAYADPYVCGTPYLESKEAAERLADDLLPILDNAARWAIIQRATEEIPAAIENAAKGYSSFSVWEQYRVTPGDLAALVQAVQQRPGNNTDTDWRSYASVTSEARDHDWHGGSLPEGVDDDGCSPSYEENYNRRTA